MLFFFANDADIYVEEAWDDEEEDEEDDAEDADELVVVDEDEEEDEEMVEMYEGALTEAVAVGRNGGDEFVETLPPSNVTGSVATCGWRLLLLFMLFVSMPVFLLLLSPVGHLVIN